MIEFKLWRILSADTAIKLAVSVFFILVFSAIVLFSVSLVFGNDQTLSILTLVAVVIGVMAILFVWTNLKKRL